MEREICYVEMNRGSVNILSRKVAFYVEKQRGSPNVSTIIQCLDNYSMYFQLESAASFDS